MNRASVEYRRRSFRKAFVSFGYLSLAIIVLIRLALNNFKSSIKDRYSRT